MRYTNIMAGKFLARPNRFIAHVEIAGREEIVHVKNTGRCKELLLPGATVYVQHFPEGKRKTKYDLIAVEKQNLLINMDSQAPNKVVQEWLMEQEPFGKITYLKPECKHGDSRFDFYLETEAKKMFIEVKGVTLEEKGVVMFPDAPTERGVKHVQELCHCLEQGYEAAIVFVVQMSGMRYFTPNRRTHAAFAEALERAEACGVRMLALSCEVTPESLAINGEIPIHLAG
ncbi:MAG: DNA/RNA nuclease SfsA [Phascolarctobacterium sp.]|nr:DNA/RNA nuclease SfsA [Phascolarctobacterium sp.]